MIKLLAGMGNMTPKIDLIRNPCFATGIGLFMMGYAWEIRILMSMGGGLVAGMGISGLLILYNSLPKPPEE